MGFLGWWVAFAFAGAPGSDVVAERVVAAAPTEVSDYLSKLNQVAAVFPEDCAQDWIVGPALRAPDATGEVVVRAALLKRRLTFTYGEMIPGRIVDLDYLGDKGFVTRFELSDPAGGEPSDATQTRVVMTTFLSPPEWPLKKYFERKIHPAWVDCQRRTLEALALEFGP